MTVQKKYYIRVRESLVEVTHEVYTAFHHAKRQERTQLEKEQRNRVISYDAWDSETYIGQELLTIPDGVNVGDAVIAALMSEKLRRCLELLRQIMQRPSRRGSRAVFVCISFAHAKQAFPVPAAFHIVLPASVQQSLFQLEQSGAIAFTGCSQIPFAHL